MSEARPSPSWLRRSGAVLAGLLAIFALSLGTDVVMHATGVFPPWGEPMSDGLFVLATAYRTVFAIAGCYLAARLAPDSPMMHALVLGSVGVVLSTAGAVATMEQGSGIRAQMVSSLAHRHGDAVRVGGRTAHRSALAGTDGDLKL
jgi:hypothetical protein